MSIHPTAVIDPLAEIASDAEIGAYVTIDGPVKIGSGAIIHAHAHITGHTTLAEKCEVHPFAVIGGKPQDFKYAGEVSYVVIGPRTILREYVTVHRSSKAGGTTSIGSDCMLMTSAHVAHDCKLGNGVVMVNCTGVAGHVEIGDRAFVSGYATVHQFTRVGRRAMIVGTALIQHDIPPFFTADFEGSVAKVNVVGCRREGFSPQTITEIKNAYRLLYRSDFPFKLAVEELKKNVTCPEVQEIVDFLTAKSSRGIAGPPRSRRRNNEPDSDDMDDDLS